MTKNKITEGNAFALNIRQAVWRTLGGVIQPLQASELVDVHLYVGSGSSKSTATEYPVTADGDTISAVMPATLKRGVYRTWLTALYQGREVASACECAFEIVPFDEHYQAYAPERVDAPMAVYLQPADMTDAELEQLKEEFRAKNAALDAAKAEAEQARQEYISKAEALESIATSEQVVALGALTSEEIGRVKELIGTPAEGQADTLFEAIKEPNIEVAKGKEELALALISKGIHSLPTDTLQKMANDIRSIELYSFVLGRTEWEDGYNPKNAEEAISNYFAIKSLVTSIENVPFERYLSGFNFSSVIFDKIERIDFNNFLNNCERLESVSFPNLITVNGNWFVSNNKSLKNIHIPKLYSAKTGLCGSCQSLKEFSAPLLYSVGNEFLANCSKVETILVPNLSDFINALFINVLNIKHVEFGTLLRTSNPIFKNSQNILEYISVGVGTKIGLNLQNWGDNILFDSIINSEDFNNNFTEGIANRLYDFVANGESTRPNIRLGKYAFEKLSQETIDMCTAKGWNVVNG